jgi:hypothetical protein
MVQVKLQIAAYHDMILAVCNLVNLLDCVLVDFIIYVKALDVLSIAFNDVNEVIDSHILPDENIRIMDLVLLKNVLDHLLVNSCKLQGGRNLDTTVLSESHLNVRLLLIQPDAHFLQLNGEFPPLIFSLRSLKHHKHQITALCYCNDLPPTPSPLRSPLDNAREIKQLDFCLLIVDNPGNASKRSKLVSSNLRFGISDTSQDC